MRKDPFFFVMTLMLGIACAVQVKAQEAEGEMSVADDGGRYGRLGLTAKASTLGYGLDVTMHMGKYANLRAGGNYLSYEYEGEEGDIEYDVDFEFISGALLLDWHPTGGSFRVSLGGIYNGNNVDLLATPSLTYTVGTTVYTADQIGHVTGTADWDPVSPYAAIGWGNAVGRNGKIHVMVELGVMYLGEPDVNLVAHGPIASVEAFQQDLALEEQKAQDDLERYKWYPVVAIGLSYKF